MAPDEWYRLSQSVMVGITGDPGILVRRDGVRKERGDVGVRVSGRT